MEAAFPNVSYAILHHIIAKDKRKAIIPKYVLTWTHLTRVQKDLAVRIKVSSVLLGTAAASLLGSLDGFLVALGLAALHCTHKALSLLKGTF